MNSTKKRLNLKEKLLSYKKPNEISLYCLKDKKGDIFYIGITNDITSTENRHYSKFKHIDYEFQIVGVFYDRDLAEFFEIKLIQESLNQGLHLYNKVIKFKN